MSITHSPRVAFRPSLEAVKMKCLHLIHMACDPYRPELHYMRGPGPKWRAKHQPGHGTLTRGA